MKCLLLPALLLAVLCWTKVTALYTAPLADSHNRRKYAEDPQSDPDSLLGGIRDNPVVLKHLARDMLTALSHLHK